AGATLHGGDGVGNRDGGATCVSDLLDDRVGDVAGWIFTGHPDAVVGDDDVRALRGAQQRDRSSDPPTCAGDRDRFALEESRHVRTSLMLGAASVVKVVVMRLVMR